MPDDMAWLLIAKDISRETEYVVFLNEHVAVEAAAKSIGFLANSELEGIEWNQEDADKLKEVIKAVTEERWNDAIADWDEWRSDMGPLDDDVEIMKIDLVT